MTPEALEITNKIMEHIATLNDEVGGIETQIAVLTERVSWLVRFFWLLVTAVVGVVVTQAYQIWFMRKNNKK